MLKNQQKRYLKNIFKTNKLLLVFLCYTYIGENMNINDENINKFLEKYINFNDLLCEKNNYHPNIKHLLYLIIPAFIIKYGIKNEKDILDTFLNTKINTTNQSLGNIYAVFERKLLKNESGYYTEKSIKVYNYYKASLTDLLDSLIHEFNHSINSYNNEIKSVNNIVYVRTGLSFIVYGEDVKKSNSIILEEIINTKETEEIINLINSFSNYSINNTEFNNFLYSLKNEVGNKYDSNAYSYVTSLCKDLINNKTFLSTITNMRYGGYVDDIEKWFDTIAGDNAYNNLNKYLTEIIEIDKNLGNAKWYNKNKKINKAQDISRKVLDLITEFNKNTIYK